MTETRKNPKGDPTVPGGDTTSPLVSGPAMVLWTIGLILSLYQNSEPASGLFLLLLLLSGITGYWGRRAIREVSLQMSCSQVHLFPGQQTRIRYQIHNGKFLPLPWLELSQNSPEKDCLVPDEGFRKVHIPGTSGESLPALRQSLPRVGSHRTIQVDHTWTARCRGLYPIDTCSARSGDGFGLVQREAPLPFSQLPTIAVFPAQVDVDTGIFLRSQWNVSAGRNGWMEDQTILRGNREYQPGDRWKSINWRMAAREQGLPVNLYQTIRPCAVHFVLDGESFAPYPYELEEVLSILGSLITNLSSRQMNLSLALPASARMEARTLRNESADVIELLLALAGYDCLAAKDPNGTPDEGTIPYLPSEFRQDAVATDESIWLITHSGRKLPALIDRCKPAATHILTMQDWEVPGQLGWRSLPLRSLVIGGSGDTYTAERGDDK